MATHSFRPSSLPPRSIATLLPKCPNVPERVCARRYTPIPLQAVLRSNGGMAMTMAVLPCLLQSRIKMDSPRLGDICQNIGISIHSRTEIITPSTNLERDILSALFEFPRDASFTRFPWPAKADRLGSLASHDAHSLSLSFLAVAYFVSENQSSGRRLGGRRRNGEKKETTPNKRAA